MGKKTPASKNKDQHKHSSPDSSVERVKPAKNGDNAPEVEKVSLITHPVKTLQLFSRVLFKLLKKLGGFAAKHSLPISLFVISLVLLHVIHGPHTPVPMIPI